MTENPSLYNKSNPFLAPLTQRYSLCRPGSKKNTCHVVIDLKGSGMSYQVGDSISVMPFNDPALVDCTLKAMQAVGSETILDKHTKEPWSLYEYLMRKADLTQVPRKLITELGQRQKNKQKKERFEFIQSEGEKEALKEYQASHEVWDALDENQEVQFSPQELCNLLQPLLPRFYSIASSMAEVGDEVHLTVAELAYLTNGHMRRGVCTHYLCQLAPMNERVVPIYVQPSNGFTLPENPAAPIIMVGPGTGVAPFRGFMQEREARAAAGFNWLFFGEWHRAHEFFYEEYWEKLVKGGKMRLDTAFSRDQEHKIYVQHRMLEHGKELFQFLEQGAYFYVCGDAHRMAKDVDIVLHQIVQIYGKCDEAGAKDYIKKLKSSKHYLRDVY
jgi:sulfite reductase (NADPH) flavoprotein alpha-component